MRTSLLGLGVLALSLAACGPTGTPDITLAFSAPPSSVNVGSSVAVNVTVTRAGGLSDAVTVSLQNPPAGISASALSIPAGASGGGATLTVAANAVQGKQTLTFSGAAGAVSKTIALDLLVRDIPGNLDKSFQTTGKLVVSNLDPNFYQTEDAIPLPGGAVLALSRGQPTVGVSYGLVSKFGAGGALETGFGTNGTLKVNFDTTKNIYPQALALQSDGKIIVVGVKEATPFQVAFVARYTAAGALDTTFNSTGFQIIALGVNTATINAATVLADNKIVIVGNAQPSAVAVTQFVTVRLNKDGGLDTGFDTDGIAYAAPGTLGFQSSANAVIASSSGVFVAGRADFGVCCSNPITQFEVVKYTDTGTLDTSFSADGMANVLVGTLSGGAKTIKLQSDGKILLGGDALVSGSGKFGATRLNADGTLDATFGSAGTFSGGFSGDLLSEMILLPDGKILLAGITMYANSVDYYLLKLNADGTPDATFGSSGKVYTDIQTSDDLLRNVFLQPDGQILAVGTSYVNTTRGLSMVRYWN